MTGIAGKVTVDPTVIGSTLTVSLTTATGTTVTAYTDAAGTTPATFPADISSVTTYYVGEDSPNPIIVSTLYSGQEVAGGFGRTKSIGSGGVSGWSATIAPTLETNELAGAISGLSGTYAPLPWTYDRMMDEFDPIVLPHRGAGDFIAPENTLEAFRVGLGQGVGCIDGGDWHYVAGSNDFAVMHDTTVDRTTTSSGTIAEFIDGWRNLVVDASAWFGAGYGDLHPPTGHDVLREFGGSAVLWIESKTTGSASREALANLVESYRLKESVVLTSFNHADLAWLAGQGFHTCQWMTTGSENTPAQIVAAGIEWVGILYSVDDAVFTSFINEGIHVMPWVIGRQWQRDHFVGLGCRGVASVSPLYTEGDVSKYRRTSSPFKSGAWPEGLIPGTLENTGALTAPSARGAITSGRHVLAASASQQWALQGYACPLATPTDYTIDVDLAFDVLSETTSDWAAVTFGCSDDRPYFNGTAPQLGYSVILRQNGTLALYFRDGTGSTATGPSVATTAITEATTVAHIQIDVTPTHVNATRTDTDNPAHTISWEHTDMRGAYFHVGKLATAASTVAYAVTAVA